MSKLIQFPRQAPRMPPIDDINNADRLLGALVVGIVMACTVGALMWCFRHSM